MVCGYRLSLGEVVVWVLSQYFDFGDLAQHGMHGEKAESFACVASSSFKSAYNRFIRDR